MARAQLIGQVFVFILAALVFILIITYGYRSINFLLARQNEAVMLDVKTDLENAVASVRNDFQSVRKVTLRLPSKYEGMCFFNYATCATVANPVFPTGSDIHTWIPIDWARDACSVGSGNVFIVPRAREFDLPELYVDAPQGQGYVCVPNDGGVILRLEGTGKKVKVSAWSRVQ